MIYSLRRGATTPSTTDLSMYELGWETTNKRLYIKDNDVIRRLDTRITLNGVFNPDPTFYAPKTVQANRVIKTKNSWNNGQDPFEFLEIETIGSSVDSGSLITSGAVYEDLITLQSTFNTSLNTKVSKDGDTMTGTLTLPAMILTGKNIAFNELDGTFDMQLNDGVTLQAGQELHFYGKASIAITSGQAVQFAGVEGDHILIKPSSGDLVRANPDLFIGIATHDISVGEFGYVTAVGYVRNIDTITPGWVAGDKLYANTYLCAVAGTLTNDKPPAELVTIQVATVVKEAISTYASDGIILVRINRMSRLISEVAGLTDELANLANFGGKIIISDTDPGTPPREDSLWFHF